MISLLAKIFIRDGDVRAAYGTLCGALGIALNLMLCALKLFAGVVSGSVAVRADALNNLSDALSSVMTLVGFRVAAKRPDRGHPFGHGRMEYVAGLAVSAAVILMGAELLRSCAVKLARPESVAFGAWPAVILAVSVGVKLYMAYFNRAVGRKIGSAAVEAAAVDSLSDAVATGAVLGSMIISHVWGVNIDAWAGAAVALFIIWSGVGSARATLSPLLGSAPERDFVARVRETALAHPEILGIHDLAVHDYGPGHVMITLHAEVDGGGDVFRLHEVIDALEHELREKLGCSATVHLDPVNKADRELGRDVAAALAGIYPDVRLHDFRAVGRRLSFDAVIPYDERDSDETAAGRIRELVERVFPGYEVEVNVDRA